MVVEPWLEEPHTLCQKQSKIWCWLLRTMVCNSRQPNSPVVTNHCLDRNHGLPSQNCHAKQPLNVYACLKIQVGLKTWVVGVSQTSGAHL